MKAKPLPTQCPVCREEVAGELREHLLDHEKEALARELVAYVEAQEQSGRYAE